MRPVNALRLVCALTIALGLAAPFASATSRRNMDTTAAQSSAPGCEYVASRK